MKPITAEWIAKAEGDWLTARREMQAMPAPNFDAAVFHAQQCAEKYLKARLIEGDVEFPKTHDLGAILSLVAPLEPAWESLRPRVNALTDMGIEVRYPGVTADGDDAAKAAATADEVREMVRKSIGLPT